jgi:hypothetical protein
VAALTPLAVITPLSSWRGVGGEAAFLSSWRGVGGEAVLGVSLLLVSCYLFRASISCYIAKKVVNLQAICVSNLTKHSTALRESSTKCHTVISDD